MNWTRTSEKTVAADSGTLRAKAMELLARREHSRLELRQKLIQRGYPAIQIDPVLDRLVEERLLDEGRYAELYASARADKGYGPLRIARELRERGVSDEQVAASLAALDPFWLPKLRELHRKRFKSRLPGDVAERIQQTRVLRQQGFTLDQIKRLFEAV
ncbi:MAG: regulatory protein RecX [Candidatus Contendobacter sp.]|nr:regulatory protein RecX [Candidatus Contendobacter sp.]MDG4556956.1 regulatory protein RecX [Candidatus Contendobacter sp.]